MSSRSDRIRSGELAERAAVNLQTIRYYERRGLLRPAGRTASGYKQYDLSAVSTVQFIKQAQRLGFTLGEAGDLLRLRNAEGPRRTTVRAVAAAKVADIEIRVQQLTSMRDALVELVSACEAGKNRGCAIIEALNTHRDLREETRR